MGDLGKFVPIWASRPAADGMVAAFSVPLWLFMLIGLLILVNVVGWGIFGVVSLIGLIL